MNQPNFLHLLKAQFDGQLLKWLFIGFLVVGLTFGVQFYFGQSYRLTPPTSVIFLGLGIIMTFGTVFNRGKKPPGNVVAASSLEFLFTRAVSRRTIFYSKTCLYPLVCLLPLVLFLVLSYVKPELKLRIYNNSNEALATEQFCLANFDGAHLESDPIVKYSHYVVLPHGWVEQAWLYLLFFTAWTLAYQFAAFLLWNTRWGQAVLYLFSIIGMSGVPLYFTLSGNNFEWQLAWATHHRLLLILGLAAAGALIQSFSCRRFVNTEVLE